MFVLGRDIICDRSTACARDVCCETFFSRDCKITLHNVHGVLAFVLKTKAQRISTVLQYRSSLETAGNPSTFVLDIKYAYMLYAT